MNKRTNTLLKLPYLALVTVFLHACSSLPYSGSDVASSDFLNRSVIRSDGDLVVSAAVPDAGETLQLTGLDLYEQGIQPVWLNIENNGNTRARVVLRSVDKEYFSPIEVAYMNRKRYSKDGYADMERWFHENGLPRFVPPGESRSGLVFTHLWPGTKGFNLVAFSGGDMQSFTFFVPMPGFVADFMEVDFAALYEPEEIQNLDKHELKMLFENELGCCTTDATGEMEGGAINIALVGSGLAVRRAMLRGGWLETSATAEAKMARSQKLWGRQPDAIFSRYRQDGNELIRLHLWLAPWQLDSELVWLGQVYYFARDDSRWVFPFGELGSNEGLLPFVAAESVHADIDSARKFLLQNLWYNGSLLEVGFTGGVGRVTMDAPRVGFEGVAWFTDGLRLVAVLSEDPLALDETRFLYNQRFSITPAGGQQ